jgi:hypothetical protein
LRREFASELIDSGLLHDDGSGPVIAVPEPAWADADVHDDHGRAPGYEVLSL